jgi:hypothetical protein
MVAQWPSGPSGDDLAATKQTTTGALPMTDHNTPGRNNHARAIIEHTTAHRAAVQDELLTITEVADILRAPVATLGLPAPPRHRTAQLPHRTRRPLPAPQRHHLAATAKLRQ